MALTHPPPPPPPPHSHSSSPFTVPYNKAPRPFGSCGTERDCTPSQSPFSPFIPSSSSAFTPASSYTSPPPPPPPPVSYPSCTSSSSPPVLATPQSSVYNTPINLYSTENACEVAMGQRRGLLESQGGALPLQLNGWVVFSASKKKHNPFSTFFSLNLNLFSACLVFLLIDLFYRTLCHRCSFSLLCGPGEDCVSLVVLLGTLLE